jgi:hypothetical protein
MRAAEHAAAIFTSRVTARAQCSCGWSSVVYSNRDAAQDAWVAHIAAPERSASAQHPDCE